MNPEPMPAALPPDAAGIFMRDPLSPTVKELCYAIVHRDVQISQLRTRLTYLEENYAGLKQEVLKKEMMASTQNGHQPDPQPEDDGAEIPK